MSIYYVAADGCDNSDGLTPETAWRTISKVNEAVSGGDEIRFRCGDTFYGSVNPPAGEDPEHPTMFCSYGSGNKPVISQYKTAKNDVSVWEKYDENIYKLDLTDISKFDGNITELDPNVGFMKISGKIYYRKCFHYEEISSQWDFYCDDRYVYVYSDKNPAEYSDDIKFACNIRCMRFTNNIKVTGIVFRGTGGHGINGVTVGAYISDCEFHEIGGSRLGGLERNGKFNTTRYGNGVECWSNSSNVTVENCKFSEIYDVAITMQGGNVVKNWENMYFVNNIMWNCTQCFEIWSSGKLADTGFVNCHFEKNICIDSGFCWGYEARPNKGVSTHLLIYGLECPLCDITVKNNVFSHARIATLYKSGGINMIPKDYKIYDNIILCPEKQPIAAGGENIDEESVKAFEKMISENNSVYRTNSYN